jgi:hypothetical protein
LNYKINALPIKLTVLFYVVFFFKNFFLNRINCLFSIKDTSFLSHLLVLKISLTKGQKKTPCFHVNKRPVE